jgi:hypothetical protein
MINHFENLQLFLKNKLQLSKMKLPTSLAVLALVATTLADLKGFDISQAQSTSFWSCMRNDGYRKVNIRAYFQSCGSKGGAVDPNFLKSYNAARSAGFAAPSEIDAYMFPCESCHNHQLGTSLTIWNRHWDPGSRHLQKPRSPNKRTPCNVQVQRCQSTPHLVGCRAR